MQKVKVWDLPTRLFHWLLALAIAGAFATRYRESWLQYHVWFGEAALLLVVFRIGWGWIGSPFAKFKEFVKGPKEVLEYSKLLKTRKPPRGLGHNPLAALMIVGFLVVVILLSVTGFITLGGQEKIGILADYFFVEEGHLSKEIHEFFSILILFMLGAHVAGALADSFLHRENLVFSMFTGKKRPLEGAPVPVNPERFKFWQKGYLFLMVAVFIFIPGLYPFTYENPLTKAAMASYTDTEQELYKKECGSCHFDFHPSLLPQRSWSKMMKELDQHFGDDASLKESTRAKLNAFLLMNAGEFFDIESSRFILKSLAKEEAPMRITEARYWKRRHDEIPEEIFKRKSVKSPLNCVACHPKARWGSYEDAHIQIPEEL